MPHSDFSASNTEPFATWSGKPLLPRNLSRLWKQEPSLRRLSGLTFSPSTAQRGADAWIGSLRASRARTSALPGAGLGLTANGRASSSTSSITQTLAVRQDSFWRTSQASLLPQPPLWTKLPPPRLPENATDQQVTHWESRMASYSKEQPPASWENWPTAGGMRNGSLFQRPTWAPIMAGHDGSASLGAWLTPNVPNGGRSVSAELVANKGMTSDGEKKTVGLESQAGHWMTPSVSNSQGNEYTRDRGQAGQERLTLTGQASHWPSPHATDGTKGGPNQAGSKGDLMLPSAAAQWPTPASRDFRTPNSQDSQDSQDSRKHTGGEQLPNYVEHHFSLLRDQPTPDGEPSSTTSRPSRRRLNPAFGCWLMGWPWWWTNPGLTSCVRSETELWRCALQQRLSCFFAEPALLKREAA